LLTPIFTPPLDTVVGGERMTVQLVQIELDEKGYRFDFSEFRNFVRFAQDNGIKYFEFSHLFTQWGGKYCPKIIVKKEGKRQKLFGWHIASNSVEYKEFLDSFLPELYKEIVSIGIKDVSYIHLTDEPTKEQIDEYAQCYNLVKKHVSEIPIMDALSEPIFYQKGLVELPVPNIEHYDSFATLSMKELFVYNCCYPAHGYYSNRFIIASGLRTRILGTQLYLTGVQGFLHWGFNFYNSVLSMETINPYAVTDACGFFPGGDSFIVYPTKTGVDYSIRAELIKESLRDYNALLTLESLAGREYTVSILQDANVKGYSQYLRQDEDFLSLHNRIYAEIKERIKA